MVTDSQRKKDERFAGAAGDNGGRFLCGGHMKFTAVSFSGVSAEYGARLITGYEHEHNGEIALAIREMAMVHRGYKLSSEEHSPHDLVHYARQAAAEFTFAMIPDPCHPWTDQQGRVRLSGASFP
jgi:hypothetical protein